MWLAEGLTAINKDNSADFLGKKNSKGGGGGGGGGGVYFLTIHKKTLSKI